MSVTHAMSCLSITSFPVMVSYGDELLVDRGYAEYMVGGDILVTDAKTHKQKTYPGDWVQPLVK